MKDIKLSVKLIGGFVVVALITLIVGFIGFWGVSQTDNALMEVAKVRLPSVAALQTIKYDQQVIIEAQRSLMIPEFNKNSSDFEHQTKYIVGAWDSADKNWKIYEILPKTKEEEAISKQFQPAWEAWKKESQEFDELIKVGKRDEAVNLALGKLRQSSYRVEEHINELLQLNMKIAHEFSTPALARADVSKI